MDKKYKALKPIGSWREGDLIGNLPEDKIKQLLADGLIEESKPQAKTTKAKEVANG